MPKKQTYENYQKAYRQRPDAKLKRKESDRVYRQKTKAKRRTRRNRPDVQKQDLANYKIYEQIKQKKIERKPCERCGATENIHAHHPNYDEPLLIIWLCPSCHGHEHKSIRDMHHAVVEGTLINAQNPNPKIDAPSTLLCNVISSHSPKNIDAGLRQPGNPSPVFGPVQATVTLPAAECLITPCQRYLLGSRRSSHPPREMILPLALQLQGCTMNSSPLWPETNLSPTSAEMPKSPAVFFFSQNCKRRCWT
jgi:ribosomal protein S27AE